jgi:nucleoside 2-deoxyribosyltransferase
MKTIYLIGSLRNESIPHIANTLEDIGFEVFDSWFSPGPNADSHWKDYEQARGRDYKEALSGHAATHIFEFDKYHIDRCDIGLLVMPAGRSGHLELGYMIGGGKPGYILFEEETDRWDIMSKFATDVFFDVNDLKAKLSTI